MKSVLEESLKGARQRSSQMLTRASDNGGRRPVASMPALLGNPNNLMSMPGNQTAGHTAVQVQHFKGWVHAAVRPTAYRIAGQSIRIAKVPKTKSKPKKGQLYQKALLPNSMKHFEQGFGAEVVSSHPLLDALNSPNQVMVKWALMYVTVVSLQITGKAFWWIKKRTPTEDDDREYEVWPIPSAWMTPVHSDDKLFIEWMVTTPHIGAIERIAGDEIVYFHYPDFTDPLGSFSPMQAIDKAIVTDECIQEAQRKGFANGIHPGWLLKVGRLPDVATGGLGQRPVLNDIQRAQLIHTIKAHYRGVARHDEPMIIDGLIEDAVRATNSNAEMAYGESGKITKERISQGLGVSPVIMGQLEGANRASSLVADEHFTNGTVNPIIALLSESLTAWLGPKFAKKGERLLIFIEPATTTDTELDLKQAVALFDRGLVDGNFLRNLLLGLPPIAGGNVAWIRPELVPIVVEADGENEVNPFVQQYNARPKPTGPVGSPPVPGNNLLTDHGVGGDASAA